MLDDLVLNWILCVNKLRCDELCLYLNILNNKFGSAYFYRDEVVPG